jgi:hypothetical protein
VLTRPYSPAAGAYLSARLAVDPAASAPEQAHRLRIICDNLGGIQWWRCRLNLIKGNQTGWRKEKPQAFHPAAKGRMVWPQGLTSSKAVSDMTPTKSGGYSCVGSALLGAVPAAVAALHAEYRFYQTCM